MIKRAGTLASKGVRAYARTYRSASSNARRYLVSVMLQNFGYGVALTVFALYVRASGMSTTVVGDFEGALALAAAAVCLLLPPLVAVVGYRWLLVVAGVAFAASRLGQTLGVGASTIIALGLAYGAGDGIIRSIGVAFLSENGPEGEERTLLFTVDFVLRIFAAFAGSTLGGLLPSLLGVAMPEVEALRWTLAAAGAVLLASAVPVLGVKESPRPRQNPLRLYATSVREFRSWGRLGRLALPEALISFGAGLVMPFLPLLLKVRLDASVAKVGVIMGMMSLFMALATLTTPLVARRFGLAGTLALTEIASLPFLFVIALTGSLPLAAGAMWVRAALMNMSWPVYNQIAVEGVPAQDKPLVLGWISVAWSVAWLAGSAIGGRLAEVSYTIGYFYTAAFYAAGALTSWLLLRHVRVSTAIDAEDIASEPAEPQA